MATYPKFSFETSADEVVTAFVDEIKGKNILITGTSLNGIGFEAARALAKQANLVIITGYNDERWSFACLKPFLSSTRRLKLSEDAIKKDSPSANVRRLKLDLSSLSAVRTAAAEVNAYAEPLHVLIHNAAAALGRFKVTVDGLESQMATDHVGPFLFTKLLKSKLLASTTASYTPRVVFVSSGAHAFGNGVDLALMKSPDESKYTATDAYFQAKSANILTAIELSRRSKGTILGYSVHPGIISTNINTAADSIPILQGMGILDADGQPNTKDFEWKTIPQGAATTVAATLDPRLTTTPGAYLDDATIATDKVASHSSDPVRAEQLWNATEEIVGEKFEF
ncbi:Short-chain dehydrogenase/reductase family protein [Mycena indigotica]|uniref:Short-chain dehydrogenase/reductase family protein n=1 Tax=Mycena indigotica TaxID=2126181 RepID=A0A8H6SIN5_9AGAR|nr:Short-chain dehydrogenase/reductase family protein [Mycena indigotica]KAF7299475.1 Short-chain dehydrogenase/reductase family protein [Mycena indigotica]